MAKPSHIAAALLVSACGGGGGSNDPAQPPAAEPARPIVVVQFGDSTIKGSCAPGKPAGHCPAAVAQRELEGVATITQEGVSSAGAWHLQTGQHALHAVPFDQYIRTVEADVVSFDFGTNDAQLYSAENFRRIMRALVQAAQAQGMRVILETPTPVWDTPELAGLGERAQVLRELAAETGAILCDHHALAFQHGDEREVVDGVHRSDAGITIDGQRLAVCIRRAIATPAQRKTGQPFRN